MSSTDRHARRSARHRRLDDDDVRTGHGHGHGHPPAPPTDRRVRMLIAALLVPCALATAVGLVLLYPFGESAPADDVTAVRVDGHVTTATETACSDDPNAQSCLALTVAIAEGPLAGQSVVTEVSIVRGEAPFGAGDDVVLSVPEDELTEPAAYAVVDFQRNTPLLVLALLFAAAVFGLGGRRGLAALAALALTATTLIAFVLPAILAGRDPLAVAVVGCCAIMFGALYLTHGISARTSTAVLGTLASLVLIGLLGTAFAELAQLTGADEDTANLAAALGTGVDGRGLVLAGLMIGALGALDDVTVTQTSAVWELRQADPGLRSTALFRAAMRIGRDHVASAVNTLVLAYAGTTLPLLLVFSANQRGLGDVLTTQVIATEVVRTLVGSIGLVASVPVTTAVAVAVATRGRRPVGKG
ncbi:YibE/F family protein [Pseudonocardia cypriaca]|uniref:Putative membrane protein n=1 Tax=Pseudonocardia cypriaca TaxID=882449 RepID=A0A543GEI0_9PSEU|nr:YibE/F family protein [Pseudonocardia cypriaca]TQM44474.1 putative membrane protein [Pseudonocardia cypriaca]